jgi:hypothetical protein
MSVERTGGVKSKLGSAFSLAVFSNLSTTVDKHLLNVLCRLYLHQMETTPPTIDLKGLGVALITIAPAMTPIA